MVVPAKVATLEASVGGNSPLRGPITAISTRPRRSTEMGCPQASVACPESGSHFRSGCCWTYLAKIWAKRAEPFSLK